MVSSVIEDAAKGGAIFGYQGFREEEDVWAVGGDESNDISVGRAVAPSFCVFCVMRVRVCSRYSIWLSSRGKCNWLGVGVRVCSGMCACMPGKE